MVFACTLCQRETCYVSTFCDKCQSVQNLIKVYGLERVVGSLNTVFVRQDQGISSKVKAEVAAEGKKIEKCLAAAPGKKPST